MAQIALSNKSTASARARPGMNAHEAIRLAPLSGAPSLSLSKRFNPTDRRKKPLNPSNPSQLFFNATQCRRRVLSMLCKKAHVISVFLNLNNLTIRQTMCAYITNLRCQERLRAEPKMFWTNFMECLVQAFIPFAMRSDSDRRKAHRLA